MNSEGGVFILILQVWHMPSVTKWQCIERAPCISHSAALLGAETYNPGSCWAFYAAIDSSPQVSSPTKLPVSTSLNRAFFKSFISVGRLTLCVPLTEPQFMLLKIAINVAHCVAHAVELSARMIYILF